MKILVRIKGSAYSGNYGHAGIPGKRGGSAPRSSHMPIKSSDWMERQEAASGEWNERERSAREDFREWNEDQDTKAYLAEFQEALGIKNLAYVMKTVQDAVEYAEKADMTVQDLEKAVDSQLEWSPIASTNQQAIVKHITDGLIPGTNDIIQVDSDYANYRSVRESAVEYAQQVMEEIGIPITPLIRRVFIDTIPKREDLYAEPADNHEVVISWKSNRAKLYESLPEADKAAIRTALAEKAYDWDLADYDMNISTYPKVRDFIGAGKLRQSWDWARENSGPQWDGKVLPGFSHQFAKALAALANNRNLGWEASPLRY